MSEPNLPPSSPARIQEETRQLVIMWAMCCCSPLVYLGVGWLLTGPLKFNGMLPLEPETWRQLILGAAGIAVLAQVAHLIIRLRSRAALEAAVADPARFMKLLTRRTFILIALSELPVFIGFCLFCIQGTLTPIFGLGVASMLLYAQSHPRNANPLSA